MTPTAKALAAVEDGMTITEAARKFGISRGSIYKLMAFRAQRLKCPRCGTNVKREKLEKPDA